MAFTKTKIFTLLLIPINVFLIYGVVHSVNSKIKLSEQIIHSEKAVIQKLILIRSIQKAYLDNHGEYCGNWKDLVEFAKNGKVYNVEKIEEVITRHRDDPEYFKGDIIKISYDTIGFQSVIKALVDGAMFPNFNPDHLPHIPNTEDKKFTLEVSTIVQGNINAPVIEVIDPYPLDKTRSDSNENRKHKFLRFGSLNNITTTGNWE